jgi:hypothetical protein
MVAMYVPSVFRDLRSAIQSSPDILYCLPSI